MERTWFLMTKRSARVKLFGIYDVEVDKILISKKESYDKKAHLNTFLDIMMMMSSDHYV